MPVVLLMSPAVVGLTFTSLIWYYGFNLKTYPIIPMVYFYHISIFVLNELAASIYEFS
jgi:hypothetical protein